MNENNGSITAALAKIWETFPVSAAWHSFDSAKAPFPGVSGPMSAADFAAYFYVTSESLSGYGIEGKIRLYDSLPASKTSQGNERGMTMIQPSKEQIGALVKVWDIEWWYSHGDGTVPGDDTYAVLESCENGQRAVLRHVRSRGTSPWPRDVALSTFPMPTPLPDPLATGLDRGRVLSVLGMSFSPRTCSGFALPSGCLSCGGPNGVNNYVCIQCTRSEHVPLRKLVSAWMAHAAWVKATLAALDRQPVAAAVDEPLVPRLTPQEMACIAERTFRQAEMKRLIEADGGFVCLGCALRAGTHRGDTLCDACWSVMHASLRPEIVDRDGKPLLPALREPWSPSVSDADCLGVDV